jgi:hypothetical protein
LRLRRTCEPKTSREERKRRNRITAKHSRDRKNAYIQHLEMSLRIANQRIMELERRIESMERVQHFVEENEAFVVVEEEEKDEDHLLFASSAFKEDGDLC